MNKHATGSHKAWPAARLELLETEKELTRRSDEPAQRRLALPRARVDKANRVEAGSGRVRKMISSQRAFLGVSMLLFAASAIVTVIWCGTMSSMGGMTMPGDWTMSMAWMRMPGQSWSGAAAAFLGMWTVMMVAMMLPALVPMLLRYRRDLDVLSGARRGWLTAVVGAGYFSVWAAFGAIAFPVGVGLAMAAMGSDALARAVPLAAGGVVVLAGALQFSSWKAQHLACCRGVLDDSSSWVPLDVCGHGMASVQAGTSTRRGSLGRGASLGRDASVGRGASLGREGSHGHGGSVRAGAVTAWRHGVRLGLHCTYCCAGLTAILLVIGVMDLRAMAIVTAAITLERLAPAGLRVARILGVVIVGAGLVLIARAM